jgi:hypothetical protein
MVFILTYFIKSTYSNKMHIQKYVNLKHYTLYEKITYNQS